MAFPKPGDDDKEDVGNVEEFGMGVQTFIVDVYCPGRSLVIFEDP